MTDEMRQKWYARLSQLEHGTPEHIAVCRDFENAIREEVGQSREDGLEVTDED